ncbi:hypothetical protein [Halostella sp. PRR32]|uniref:hypothetical protein n=1 Tax=Halostella sp. PRR32 TaxID=3098147 RepID=UPI002B1DC395|nr:hypothetical protein [Halostella sp. PRR32]
MGWGVSVTGVANVLSLFDQLETNWSGDTLYLTGPSVEYAIHHEYGTSKMEARPFMRPAAERVKADPMKYAKQYANGPIQSEEQLVGAVALAIEREAKKIVKRKDIWDQGNLHGSIEARRVR